MIDTLINASQKKTMPLIKIDHDPSRQKNNETKYKSKKLLHWGESAAEAVAYKSGRSLASARRWVVWDSYQWVHSWKLQELSMELQKVSTGLASVADP